jgi:hypothetical protein
MMVCFLASKTHSASVTGTLPPPSLFVLNHFYRQYIARRLVIHQHQLTELALAQIFTDGEVMLRLLLDLNSFISVRLDEFNHRS